MAPTDLNAWLVEANERFRKSDVEHRQRPFLAVSEYGTQFRQDMVFSSPLVKAIFDFFVENGPPGAHAIGALFTNAFFFDAHFWPLLIPIGFGQPPADPFAALNTMQDSVKDALRGSPQHHARLLLHWAECHDYAFGLNDLSSQESIGETAHVFIRNGTARLKGAVDQLVLARPNTMAALDLGLAAEILMKGLLIQEQNLTEDQLIKKFGHRVAKIADECFKVTGEAAFKQIAKHAAVYPKVADRYDGEPPSAEDAWKALALTTVAGACVVRKYSDRGMRGRVLEHLEQAR